MIYTPLTKKALAICFEAHKNQKDKSGMPYVFHPFHVAENMKTEAEVCTALLHDVLEDTDTTDDDLRCAGMPTEVLEALKLLNHDKAVPYLDYIGKLKGNVLACTVKKADLLHNADLSRLDQITEDDRARAAKYQQAISVLESPVVPKE